jgi:hypothetical protein
MKLDPKFCNGFSWGLLAGYFVAAPIILYLLWTKLHGH